jgi:hypothetical protein
MISRSFRVFLPAMLVLSCQARERAADTVTARSTAIITPSSQSRVQIRGDVVSSDSARTTWICDDETRAFANPRPEWARAVGFLDRLVAGAPESNTASAPVRFPPAAEILSSVSDSGITYVDVNGIVSGGPPADTIQRLSPAELRAQIETRKGPFFRHLQNMTYRASQVDRARSFCPIPGGVTVLLGRGYEASFRNEAGALRLVKFAYLGSDGE